MNDTQVKDLLTSVAGDHLALTRTLINKGVISLEEVTVETENAHKVAERAMHSMTVDMVETVNDALTEERAMEMAQALMVKVAESIQMYLQHGWVHDD